MKIAPDLVWVVDGVVRACIDVKYKVEKHGQYPNADLYQMAAYCRRFGLGDGWLVYAASERDSGVVEVMDGPIIRCAALESNSESLDMRNSLARIPRSAVLRRPRDD
ncbi:5-methylcytosine restriction system specificity protein McrC [Curtobacterium flaccumfaciens]|uniref:5-methylcytosine restriction system specificity protein McrC n=1 Tax=Curtobacterium flaccumfaciens TaxID=2035 RepID=UPI0027DC33AE|nr:hypothetical protein [Curtobacterium flaccumfaciens]